MKKLVREDIVDWQTYDDRREAVRAHMIGAVKPPRRVHVGPYLTFLFENRDTVIYQIQEMMRAERIVRDAEIRHEIETYNELLGGEGALGATLLVEIAEPALRDVLLRKWTPLLSHIYCRVEGGAKVYASWDSRQVSAGRLSSVHYLQFALAGQTPVAVGCDWEGYAAAAAVGESDKIVEGAVETRLSTEQRQALADDLAS